MTALELCAAATAADRARIAALARVIWREYYPGIISRAQIEYMLAVGYSAEALADDAVAGTRFTLAWQADAPVGFAAVSPEANDADNAWLDKLYVRAEVRGGGVGSALVQRAFDDARELGARTLRLRVNRFNASAIAAYRRYGFTIETADVKDIGGGYVMDDYIMMTTL